MAGVGQSHIPAKVIRPCLFFITLLSRKNWDGCPFGWRVRGSIALWYGQSKVTVPTITTPYSARPFCLARVNQQKGFAVLKCSRHKARLLNHDKLKITPSSRSRTQGCTFFWGLHATLIMIIAIKEHRINHWRDQYYHILRPSQNGGACTWQVYTYLVTYTIYI